MVKIEIPMLVLSLVTMSTIAAMSDIKKGPQTTEFLGLTGKNVATLCTMKIFKNPGSDPFELGVKLQDYMKAEDRAKITLQKEAVPTNINPPSEADKKDVKEAAPVIKDTGVTNTKKDVVENKANEPVVDNKAAEPVVEDKEKKTETAVKDNVNPPVVGEIKDKEDVNVTEKQAEAVQPIKNDAAVGEPPKNVAEKSLDQVKAATEPLLGKAKDAIAGNQTAGEYGIAIECFSPVKDRTYKRFTYEGSCKSPDNKLRVMYIQHVENKVIHKKEIAIDQNVDEQIYSYLQTMSASEKADITFVSEQCALTVSSVGIIAVFVSILALLY